MKNNINTHKVVCQDDHIKWKTYLKYLMPNK